MLVAFSILYLGIRAYRGNDNLVGEGDRDNAVVMVASGLLNGNFVYSQSTQLGNVITTGPTSGLISAPSVALIGSNHLTSVILFLVLIFALYRKREQFMLAVSIAYMVFHNHFNWGYWEGGDEILYGWFFLIPAVFLVEKLLKDNQKPGAKKLIMIGVLFGLSVGCRISYALPIGLIGMILFFRKYFVESITIGFVTLLSFVLVSLPYIYLGSPLEFWEWLNGIWLHRRSEMYIMIMIVVILGLTFLQIKKNLPLSFFVVVTAMLGHFFANMFFVRWQTYYYMFPLLFWLPEWITIYLRKLGDQGKVPKSIFT
ncbi:hypothetical protein ACFL27_24440 [candidate division CSSED10-310 bacterium]|uniref:Glycosyltransferase RgtA/B/C/D-like domain-containing protein n=1 Tax=candidate division CSSED10-310 bacterium TaxID=2855610 RepID=A0ABV6Z4I1_UNCC1